MKKKFLLLPLLMLVLGSCTPNVGPISTDPSGTDSTGTGSLTTEPTDDTGSTSTDPTDTGSTSTDPTDTMDPTDSSSTDTSTDPNPIEKLEIDPTELNGYLGFDVYSLLPKIYSNDYEVSDWSDEDYPVDVYIDLYDWSVVDVEDYDGELASKFVTGGKFSDYEIDENLYIYVDYYAGAYINIYSFAEEKVKSEIDPTELNSYFDRDVYSLLPKIYSDNYITYDWSEDGIIEVSIIAIDWTYNDALAYFIELDSNLDYSYLEEAHILDENLFAYVGSVTSGGLVLYGVFVYTYAEASGEKLEIDPSELNSILGFDVYSLLPPIYSNNYEVYDWSDDDYPVDIYLFLEDWSNSDLQAYLAALNASDLAYETGYGYVLADNLFLLLQNSPYGVYINIYSDANYVPVDQAASWPVAAINEFFGSSEIGSSVPAFVSNAPFSYYVVGEGEDATLIIYTDYDSIDGEDIYVAQLEAAGWTVDDSLYDYFGYVCWDAEEQISLIFYWWDGVIYFSFMVFAEA